MNTIANMDTDHNNIFMYEGDCENLVESNFSYNDLNRQQIKAFAKEHKECWLGKINFYGKERKDITAWKISPLTIYQGQKILNLNTYTFCVPVCDKRLIRLIRHWNKGGDECCEIELIINRIRTLGGLIFNRN